MPDREETDILVAQQFIRNNNWDIKGCHPEQLSIFLREQMEQGVSEDHSLASTSEEALPVAINIGKFIDSLGLKWFLDLLLPRLSSELHQVANGLLSGKKSRSPRTEERFGEEGVCQTYLEMLQLALIIYQLDDPQDNNHFHGLITQQRTLIDLDPPQSIALFLRCFDRHRVLLSEGKDDI